MGRLVIDGKEVYELDEDCLRRKQKLKKKETEPGAWYTHPDQRKKETKIDKKKKET